MKTSSVFLITLFLCSFSAQAQHYLGVKGGYNINNFFFTDFLEDNRVRVMPFPASHYGLVYQHFTTPHLGVQADLMYIRKGWQERWRDAPPYSANYYRTNLDFVNFSVMSNLALGKKKFKAFLSFGPYIGWVVNSSDFLSRSELEERIVVKYDPEIDHKFDFGVQGNLGVSYLFPFGKIQLEGGWQNGFRSIINSPPTIRERPAISYSQAAVFSLSYFVSFSDLFGKKE